MGILARFFELVVYSFFFEYVTRNVFPFSAASEKTR
jgi:hypothetical protein